LAIWRIFRRSPLSEEKYPNRNPAWKQALLIIDFQGFTRKGSSTSLSAGDDQIKVTLNRGGFDFSDDVYYRIIVDALDVNGNVTQHSFVNRLDQNANSFTSFTQPFIGSFATIPNVGATDTCTMTLEVFSHSNIDWSVISFRPKVEIQTDCIGEPIEIYPNVGYELYNHVEQLEGSNPMYPRQALQELNPDITENKSNIQSQVFGGISGHDIDQTVYFVAKSGGKMISKRAIVFHLDASGNANNSVTLKTVDINTGEPLNSITSLTTFNGDAAGTFSNTDVIANDVEMEFFAESSPFAQGALTYIKNYLNGVHLVNPSYIQFTYAPSLNFNMFYGQRDVLGTMEMGWGQFAWSGDFSQPILTSDMKVAGTDTANNQSAPYDENTLPKEDAEGVNPWDNNFFSMVAVRGENAVGLRDYIESDLVDVDERDHWSVFGTYMGLYREAGKSVPGILGETPEAESVTPSASVYAAYGASRVNESYSLNENLSQSSGPAPFVMGQSNSYSIQNDSKYFGRMTSGFQDMNGDGYPDRLMESGDDVDIQFTNSSGGHESNGTLLNNEVSTKSIPSNSGLMFNGSYSNERKSTAKIKNSVSASASVNFGSSAEAIEYVDVNGDGLADRIINGTTDYVAINNGLGFDAPIAWTLPLLSINASENTSKSIGASASRTKFKELNKNKPKLSRSFSAGVGINNVGSNASRMGMDINGDGLTDIIYVSGSNAYVYLNTGTGYVLHQDHGSNVNLNLTDEINQSQSIGFNANVSASVGIPLSPFVKMSISGNAGANYSVNKLRSSFMDINGDGAPDFVTAEEDGDIKVYYSNVQKSNLLTTVTNPLGGSFDIEYDLEGRKTGVRDAQVLTHRTGEKVVWDMPTAKWALSEVTIHDGVNMTNDSGDDLDGEETMQVFFNYDGGIHNRREKSFAGFTRVETRQANQVSTGERYLTEVVEYFAPDEISFESLKKHDYQKGLVRNTYALLHTVSGSTHDVDLISQQNSNYEIRMVDIASSSITSGSIGQVKQSSGNWVKVNWSTIDESSTVFPAVLESEALNYPQITSSNYHSQQFEITYDAYFNVTQYKDKADMTPGTPTEVIVDTIYSTKVLHYDQINNCSSFPTTEVASAPGLKGYEIAANTSGYSADTVWVLDMSGNCPPTDVYGINPCSGGEGSFTTHHTKEVEETTYVYKTVSNASYTSDRIAVMEYFTPAQAGGRTGVLKKHSIYNGSISTGNPIRESEVTALTGDDKGVATMRTKLNSSEYAQNDLSYDTYGNVTKVQGPANRIGQRDSVTYTYDATLNQFVTGISNQFGESVCNTYDYHTGQMLQTIGINGHAMIYEYDDFNRLEKVWAPREVNISGSAPTIQYSYRLHSINSGTVVPARAITVHNLANTSNTTVSYTPKTCGTTIDLSTRPELTSGVRTATFVDGNAKAVQLQTEQSKVNGTVNALTFITSGPQVVDKFGRTEKVYADFAPSAIPTTYSFGEFVGLVNLSDVDLMQKNVVYDYNNRVTSSDTWTAESGTSAGQWVTTQMEFDWNDDLTSGTDKYYEKTSVLSNASGLTNTTPDIENATYTDSRGRKVGTITYGATSADDIITKFNYNNIGELTEVVDPIGLSTLYTYDLAGRVLTEQHPDRGLTLTDYDPASNVIRIQTPGTLSFGGTITMDYNHNRLTHKYMPSATGSDLYDIVYTYGSKNDGRNGAGRVTQINQGGGFKIDLIAYDELGQVVEEETNINVPTYGLRGFVTTKRYDSFGRIIQATYPDGDQVDYGYTSLGELYSIDSKVGGVTQSIVSGILYNGFGQISKLSYGNGTYTDYDYTTTGTNASTLKQNTLFKTTTKAKEQGATSQSTVLERNYTYNTQGMVSGLDRDVAGTLMNSGLGTMVSLSDNYNYDKFGRFDNHAHTIGGNAAYSLDMTYNKAGGITLKDANAGGVTNAAALDYTLHYTYNATNPHQLDNVVDSKSGIQSHYQYNSSGSIKEIQDPAADGPQTFYWNEEQWLSGVSNTLGTHHYVYDHKGERIMKSSVQKSSVQVNDQNIDDVQYLDPYTLYINPYYVVTELQGGDKVSKHYYMNTQRVATDISINYQGPTPMAGPQQPNAPNPQKPSADTASVNYNAAFADLQETLAQLGQPKLDVEHMGKQPTLEQYYPELIKTQHSNSTMAAKNSAQSVTRVLFWYHPDYLGNVDLVTERDGKTYEFFTYNPWGEQMHHYNANTFGFTSPYRFNSKEKDAETGLHYYGARYYQSKLSVWMSVDPLAAKYPSMSPYNFSGNNPIMYVDPNGMWIEGAGFWNNLFNSDEKILAENLADKHEGATITEFDDGYQVNYNLNDGYMATEDKAGQISTTESVFFSNKVDRDSEGNIVAGTISPGQSDALNTIAGQSSTGQLNRIGAYGEASWYLSGVAGQDYGVMYSKNVGWMTYRTEHFGFKTEAAGVGIGLGAIIYTGNPSELLITDFNGMGVNTELNFSVGVADVGGSIVVAPVNKGGRTEYLMFVGAQGSVGASTPVASGGVTKATTYVN